MCLMVCMFALRVPGRQAASLTANANATPIAPPPQNSAPLSLHARSSRINTSNTPTTSSSSNNSST